MARATYPANLSELDFVEAYFVSALRKPQMAADAALRTLVLAGALDRVVLAGLIAEQLAEACRRLTAVHDALADRTYPVAQSLLQPLPGADRWEAFIQAAATLQPDQMVWRLGVGEEALEAARSLRSQPDLSALTPLVRVAASGAAMCLVPLREGRPPTGFWIAGGGGDSDAPAVPFDAFESDAAALADRTADLVAVARGFLGAYLDARRDAGRRD